MNLKEFLDKILFSIGEYNITVENVTLVTLSILFLSALFYFTFRRWLPRFFEAQELETADRRKIRGAANFSFLFLGLLLLVASSGINPTLYDNGEVTFRLSALLGILLAWQLARLTDIMVSRALYARYLRQREEARESHIRLHLPQEKKQQSRTIQYVVYLIAVLILLNSLQLDPNLGNINLGKGDPVNLTISKILVVILTLLIAQVISWILTQLVLYRYYKSNDINIGSQYAINQLIRYVIFVIAILTALQTIGINMTVIWGGAAALLVGIGLGLQQTFNDFFSGLVLLFERSVEVGDVVNVGGLIGTVRRIGLRSSRIQTRDNITVVVPNSKLVVDNVVNWSHNDNRARFYVSVGVAYGSDTALVREILTKAAADHEKILKFPQPFVRFLDFGNSSLDFEVHFWTTEFIQIEDVKSDLRFAIDQAFREHDVTIPFPQRDVWFKNALQNENGQAPLAPQPREEEADPRETGNR